MSAIQKSEIEHSLSFGDEQLYCVLNSWFEPLNDQVPKLVLESEVRHHDPFLWSVVFSGSEKECEEFIKRATSV